MGRILLRILLQPLYIHTRLVQLSWTYGKTETRTLPIPGPSSRSSCTFWVLRYWPKMRQNPAIIDLGYTQSQYILSVAPSNPYAYYHFFLVPSIADYGKKTLTSVETPHQNPKHSIINPGIHLVQLFWDNLLVTGQKNHSFGACLTKPLRWIPLPRRQLWQVDAFRWSTGNLHGHPLLVGGCFVSATQLADQTLRWAPPQP